MSWHKVKQDGVLKVKCATCGSNELECMHFVIMIDPEGDNTAWHCLRCGSLKKPEAEINSDYPFILAPGNIEPFGNYDNKPKQAISKKPNYFLSFFREVLFRP